MGRGQGSLQVDRGYYLRQRHRLIHRHTETVALNPDHTARWQLRVDFELPSEEGACWVNEAGEEVFLFPLAFLKKEDPRTGFEVRDESGALVPIPIRSECDRLSTLAAGHALESLHASIKPSPQVSVDGLKKFIGQIAAGKPFQSSLILRKIFSQVERKGGGRLDSTALGSTWKKHGLLEVLHMLVDHSLIWVPLRGKGGERRTLVLTQEISMVRRVFLRWIFGDMRMPEKPLRHPLKTWRACAARPGSYLKVGKRKYGRRTYRVSFSALGERIGQPLGWMPFEYEFPTVYTKRCRSYHFELTCPPGRSPRDLRPASGMPLAEPSDYVKRDDSEGRTILTAGIARHDRPGNRFPSDIWFRVTVGVGDGAFPALWFLAGAITAAMLWLLAGYAPEVEEEDLQIAAAILLIVPALAAGLAISDNTVPVTRLIGGARILLLVTGLSAVLATAVLIGAEPFKIKPTWTWTACAMITTAATIPLATGWLLSAQTVWRQLKRLKSRRRQKNALWVGVLLALVADVALIVVCDDPVSRGLVGVYLLLLTVGLTVLANNRAAMPIGEGRRYVSLSLMLAALTCLALGCIELQAAIGSYKGLQEWAERAALPALAISLVAGGALSRITARFSPDEDEIHVSPRVGRTLLAGEAVRELAILRGREQDAASKRSAHAHHQPAGGAS